MRFLLAYILSAFLVRAQFHNPIYPDYNDLLALLFDPSDSSDMLTNAEPFGMRFSDEDDEGIVIPKPFKAVVRRPKHPSKQVALKIHAVRPSKNRGRRHHFGNNNGSERKQLQVIHKEEPFFQPRRGSSKKNEREACRRIESKEYASKYFAHRRPIMKSAATLPKKNGRARRGAQRMMSKVKNCRECKPNERVWRVQRVIIQPPMNEGPVWTWKSQGIADGPRNKGTSKGCSKGKKRGKPKKMYSTGPPKKNQKGYKIPDGYNMPLFMKRPSQPTFPEYARKKKPLDEEPEHKKDPLESPWIRMAVAVALGALVTCGVYAIASLVCMCFPGFFGSDDDDILGSDGRPVRYVPVPVIQEKKVETVTMV